MSDAPTCHYVLIHILLSVTTLPEPPSAVSAMECTGRTKNSITLRWDQPDANSAPVLEYAVSSDLANAELSQLSLGLVYSGAATKFKVHP